MEVAYEVFLRSEEYGTEVIANCDNMVDAIRDHMNGVKTAFECFLEDRIVREVGIRISSLLDEELCD